jgi:hypothetical protein
MVAEGSHVRVVNDTAISDVPVFGHGLVYKEMVALVRLRSLVAPEALDLPAVLCPMAIVKTTIREWVEELGMSSTAVHSVPVPGGI